MYMFSLFLPLFSAVLILGFGRYIGKLGSISISVCSLLTSSFLSFSLFLQVIGNTSSYFYNLGS